MSVMDLDELENKAYHGRIEPQELAEVIDRIQKYYEHPNEEDIDSLLRIVGYAGCFGYDPAGVRSKYRGLIEKFSHFPPSPFTSSIAWDILCNDWDLTAEYIPQLKMYIRGVEWDEGEDVRIMAMCIAGYYVKERGDKKLLRELLQVFENERERKFIRELAYKCISVALGNESLRLLEFDIDTFSQNAIAQERIARAHKLLGEE